MHRRVAQTFEGTGARGAAVALLVLLGACQTQDSGLPTAPGAPVAVRPAPTTTTAVGFPELTRPGRVYSLVSEDASGYDYGAGGPLTSRYVLYDDGEFALQYLEIAFVPTGTYEDAGGFLELKWHQNSTLPAGHPYPEHWRPWEATATLVGGTLIVYYPVHMWLVGFLDAVYERTE
jgi:hypothetical protein